MIMSRSESVTQSTAISRSSALTTSDDGTSGLGYVELMFSEGLEISQPSLDPELSSEIHHPITVRNKKTKVHRRVYDYRGSLNCSDESKGPPCTEWVEGMAPVFSRDAWRCVWHLIQGDRTKKVGVIDTEFIVHLGIPYLGGESATKVQIRRQSTAELEKFKKRWNRAVREDKEWTKCFGSLT